MEKVCCVATLTGLEHGALSSYAWTIAPAPSAISGLLCSPPSLLLLVLDVVGLCVARAPLFHSPAAVLLLCYPRVTVPQDLLPPPLLWTHPLPLLHCPLRLSSKWRYFFVPPTSVGPNITFPVGRHL